MGSRLFRLSPEALHPEAAQASAALALNQKRKAARAAKAPASNIAFKISRLLKMQRDILRPGPWALLSAPAPVCYTVG